MTLILVAIFVPLVALVGLVWWAAKRFKPLVQPPETPALQPLIIKTGVDSTLSYYQAKGNPKAPVFVAHFSNGQYHLAVGEVEFLSRDMFLSKDEFLSKYELVPVAKAVKTMPKPARSPRTGMAKDKELSLAEQQALAVEYDLVDPPGGP